MNIDNYFPHDTHMRNTPEVISLIESENASGYGIYWVILEYLRTQEDYKGDIRAIKGIARQVKARLNKAIRVLNDYGLFVIEGTTFYSPFLNEMMKPLEQKRAKRTVQKRSEAVFQNEQSVSQNDVSVSQPSCNGLEMKEDFPKVKESKVKKNKTTSKEEDADDVWESYVDALRHEQQWQEIMAMRSGMGLLFVNRFDEVLQHFKYHVQAVGNETNIRSLSDAKHYFNNFNTPGSLTFIRMKAELQKPIDKGKFKHEDRDSATGKRSYCGVPIPADAPPRPNAQAVWCEDKWIY